MGRAEAPTNLATGSYGHPRPVEHGANLPPMFVRLLRRSCGQELRVHNQIAVKLNERNVKTARGGRWTHVQVGAILQDSMQVSGGSPEQVGQARAVGHEAAGRHVFKPHPADSSPSTGGQQYRTRCHRGP